jgi:hypothetical protein
VNIYKPVNKDCPHLVIYLGLVEHVLRAGKAPGLGVQQRIVYVRLILKTGLHIATSPAYLHLALVSKFLLQMFHPSSLNPRDKGLQNLRFS